MLKVTMLVAVLLVLAASLLSANALQTSVEIEESNINFYWSTSDAENWQMVLFPVPNSMHTRQYVAPKGWTYTLSRYGDHWRDFIEDPPENKDWAYFSRENPTTSQNDLVFFIQTDSSFHPKESVYTVVDKQNLVFTDGPILVPSTLVPEPASIVILAGMTTLGWLSRKRN